MASKDEVLSALKREWNRKVDNSIQYYNTGYQGQGIRSAETTKMSELEEAKDDFSSWVLSKVGSGHGVRLAKSFSGGEHNEWSVLVEQNSPHQSIFNFHMRVSS
jgi:hypothetical protein